ncbi:aromatic aminotransferase Aro8 [Apiospora hydei]|uniref:Aromatic aminotransferase Aro8 n=1 Tax=Apiospora hydei TaxID=1337664 RepID=A0ABR1WXD3_9PEZI
MRTLIPSLLSMDTDGRVLRHDSFSKVVVPGSRVGWVTGSEQVIERYIRHAECCSQGPSGFSQAIARADKNNYHHQQLWLKVDHTRHPHASDKSLLELEEEIFDSCIERGVLACRGSWFRAEHDRPLSGLFFRTTYAAASEEQMAVAIERFGDAVRGSFGI